MDTEDKRTIWLSCLNSSPTFFNLWNEDMLTDFKIISENEVIVAHKTVLTLGSKYFANIFRQYPEISSIDLYGTRYQDAFDIIRLLYVGQIEIEEFRQDEIFAAAEKLQVEIIHGREGPETIKIPTVVNTKVTEDKSAQADLKVDESPIKTEDLGISVLEDGNFQCNQCARLFTAKSSAIRHFKTLHIIEKETFMACPICPLEFNLKSKYEAHIQKAHQLTPKVLKTNVKPELAPNEQIKTGKGIDSKKGNTGVKHKKVKPINVKTEKISVEESKPKKIKIEQ